jgi:Secretion system C-terminal sorting domain
MWIPKRNQVGLAAKGMVKHSFQDTLPQKRKYTTNNPLSKGNYSVRVTIRDIFNQLSTPVTANFVVQNSTSIREIKETELVIYPNPSSSLLYFNEKLYKARMSIFNLNGQVFINQQIIENPINIAHLPNGMYIVKMVDETGILMQRFVKQ